MCKKKIVGIFFTLFILVKGKTLYFKSGRKRYLIELHCLKTRDRTVRKSTLYDTKANLLHS